MKLLLLSILLTAAFACASNQKSYSDLNGLDTFGSNRISASDLENKYSVQISELLKARKDNFDRYIELKQKIESDIKDYYKFAYVELSFITYFKPRSGDYLTIDVVEPHDTSKRMNFLTTPYDEFADPDGLIALWDEYLNLGFEIVSSGKFEYPKTCPAWHCTHGFEHPRLQPFLEKFNSMVPKNEAKLVEILQKDKRAKYRGNAAYLLAHIKSGRQLVKHLIPQIRDSSSLVRNNVVRVFTDLASKHPEIEMPIEPFLQALQFPTTTDRNKAAYTLVPLSRKKRNKRLIVDRAGSTLIEMLKLQQPNNHEPAYEILKNISGEKYEARDYQSWQSWLALEKSRKY